MILLQASCFYDTDKSSNIFRIIKTKPYFFHVYVANVSASATARPPAAAEMAVVLSYFTANSAVLSA